MVKISAVITTISGEEKYLASCIASVKKLVDEIVVVDMSDGKDISEIAKKYEAEVYKHEFVNYVEPVRNFGIEKATGEWILILDPDEEISHSLCSKLDEIAQNDQADYVRIPRKNIVFGEVLRHSRWWPDYNIRFFKKGYVNWDETIHSIPITQGRGIDLKDIDELAITHHHYETIEQFVERLNRYTTIQAKLKSQTKRFNWQDLISAPTGEFLGRFFAAEGYKDGVHGLAVSLLQAFSELVVHLKIWQLQKFEKQNLSSVGLISEFNKAKKEFNYWENDLLIKENGGLIPRIKRKLKI